MIDAPKFQKLRQTMTPEQQDQKLKQVSDLYEKQFLREMMKAMRSTVHESGFIKSSQAEKIFREQLDQEYVEKWGAKGGIGLADMIHNQLLDKYGAQLGIRPAVERPRGPIKLDEKSNFRAQTMKPPTSTTDLQKMSFEFFKEEGAKDEPTDLMMPWSGKILGQYRLDQDENLLHFEHDNGIQSKISFRGIAKTLPPQSMIEAGAPIGVLSPEAKKFTWSTQGPAQEAAVSAPQ
jgi:flagellar protein FlgJ